LIFYELWVTQEVGFFGVTDYKPPGWTVGLCEIRLLGDQLASDQLEWNQSAREAEEFPSRSVLDQIDQGHGV
jgi:hypothetical protein